jgi:hypothetical protein
MQAYLDPQLLEAMKANNDTQTKAWREMLNDKTSELQEMINNKVPYNQKKMLGALSIPGVAKVVVAPIQPGDIISENGKRYKVIRINDKGEAIKEEII